jgi:hypothetical protein
MPNYVEAYKWFSVAATFFLMAADAEAHRSAIIRRNLLAVSMTPEQIAHAEALVMAWRFD